MNVELTPQQEPEIEDAVARLLEQGATLEPDPWWRAGIEESLET